MAIKRKAGGRIRGLSTDSKPTAAAEPVNTIFEETDTGKEFYNTGTTWVGLGASKYAGITTVYRIGSTYYADRWNGELIASGALETVLQAALDAEAAGGASASVVKMTQPGSMALSAAFSTPINIPNYTTLWMGNNTVVVGTGSIYRHGISDRFSNRRKITVVYCGWNITKVSNE